MIQIGYVFIVYDSKKRQLSDSDEADNDYHIDD